MNNKNKLWTERYRPQTLYDYIFHDESHKKFFYDCVHTKHIPHLLLIGTPGSGKTTIARVLLREMEVDELDVMTIDATRERGIDTFRDKIYNFINTHPIGDFKVVILEEADQLPELSQNVLRHSIEEYSDTVRFILTGNYSNKIRPAIKSRLQTFNFKAPDKELIIERMLDMVEKETVNIDDKTLLNIIDNNYPDIRKIINTLQQYSSSNIIESDSSTNDWKLSLIDYIEDDNWDGARKVICSSVSSQDEWEEIYRVLYENIHICTKFKDKNKWDRGIILIAEHLYKNAMVSDCEINMAACLIGLGQI